MKSYFRPLLAILILAGAALACASPVGENNDPGSSPDAVSTAVALTLQALTPAREEITETPEPTAGLLPHSFYYLGTDPAGLTQVFRIEKDGRSVKQVTSEPVNVEDYGVSREDGSVAYVVNNQLILVNQDGTDRRLLVDGGTVDINNPFINKISNPVFSPDGETLAYAHQGLNFYALSSGVHNRVMEDNIDDMGNGLLIPRELYQPEKYSPDGSRLLITLAYYEGASSAFYYPESKALVRLKDDQGALICCGLANWSADGMKIHSGGAAAGMYIPGLWEVDAATGAVTTLLASNYDTSTFNLAKYPYLAPDDQLYFFFLASNTGEYSRTPLQLVRSAPDGVTDRTVVREESFEMMNEALWPPDASFVIVAYAPVQEVYQGGRRSSTWMGGPAWC